MVTDAERRVHLLPASPCAHIPLALNVWDNDGPEEPMDRARILPRIFLGSSTQQATLLQALTRGLGDIAQVEPWTTSFNPGVSTLERLLELTREVDFATFVFAQDDWTSSAPAPSQPGSGQASPRDNVVFEAGLFGGVLGMRRTFILHAHGTKLPSACSASPA